MDTDNGIQLHDPETYPSEDVLKGILGSAYAAYAELLELYDRNSFDYEWRYYNDGKTWLCKVQHKKRTIVWMSAWKGYIQATIYIAGKYVNDLYGLSISADAMERIRSAKDVGKSKPCTFKLAKKNDLDDFEGVMQFKLIAK